jgi:hypothetical protein
MAEHAESKNPNAPHRNSAAPCTSGRRSSSTRQPHRVLGCARRSPSDAQLDQRVSIAGDDDLGHELIWGAVRIRLRELGDHLEWYGE